MTLDKKLNYLHKGLKQDSEIFVSFGKEIQEKKAKFRKLEELYIYYRQFFSPKESKKYAEWNFKNLIGG